jgi:ParB/RepB/Spo0J family partition protein
MSENLKTIAIADIIVEDRARKDLKDIEGLATSIKESGLICPIAVALKDGKYFLMAGERRLSACKLLGSTVIQARIYTEDLDRLDKKIVEMAENLYRANLEWDEEVALIEEIHKLQIEKFGKKSLHPGSANAPGWSETDTAKMTGRSQAGVSNDLRVAEMLHLMPELKKCKDKKEVLTIINRVGRNIEAKEKADEILSAFDGKDDSFIKKDIMSRFVVGDFLTADIKPKTFDLVEIDPPYGIDLEMLRKNVNTIDGGKAHTLDGYNEVRAEVYPKFLESLIKKAHAILKDDGWLLFWFAFGAWYSEVLTTLKKHFEIAAVPAIWKKNIGQTMCPNYILGSTWEPFFYCHKGKPELNKKGRSNIFEFDSVPAQHRIHPTERPIEMMEEILSTFVTEGSNIAVPCCGSGNTLLAAHNISMNAIGWELSQQYKDLFVGRVEAGTPFAYRSYGYKD